MDLDLWSELLDMFTVFVCIYCRPTIWQYMLFAGIPSIRTFLPAVVLIGQSKYGTTLESKQSLLDMYICSVR